MYEVFESQFRVNYPKTKNATYTSKLNYSTNMGIVRQRWYRYKEGFSFELVSNLIHHYNQNPHGIILDPFLGSGSTSLVANKLGFKSIGFEINPFSYFLSKCKLTNYSIIEAEEFLSLYNVILNNSEPYLYKLPKLSTAHKVFDKQIEAYLMSIKEAIGQSDCTAPVRDLLKLGWLASLEGLSNYRKAGNGLKIKKYSKPRIQTVENARVVLQKIYSDIYEDITQDDTLYNTEIYNMSSMDMNTIIQPESISGIIFSPPYANCFDYTEIYKLELWFGDFIETYEELRLLRKKTLRSHLSANLNSEFDKNYEFPHFLRLILSQLEKANLWDKRIPQMIRLYFQDMFFIIKECFELLEFNGFCAIIVGNSSYGDIVIPTDLILADFAKRIGFKVDKIEIDRFIIPSSQQYAGTLKEKRYLRESVICLVK